MQEDEPRLNPDPQNTGTTFERLAEQINTRVIDPIGRFAVAPLSLAQSYRERHPKIATAIAVGVTAPPVLLGAGYAWASGSLLEGVSAGSDLWIVECVVTNLWSRTHPSIETRL